MDDDDELLAVTAATVTAGGHGATPLGVLAIELARQIIAARDEGSITVVAALSRELRATMTALDARSSPAADAIDELGKRRGRRRGAS